MAVTAARIDPRRRPILVGLGLAILAAVVVLGIVLLRPDARPDATGIGRGEPAPEFEGTTLDGATLALADFRGRPVIVNFWGPSCVPCRDEFPLFLEQLAEHAVEGFAIIGVLMFDPPAPARDFVADFGATWPTIDDPDGSIRTAYRAVARPQTYFIDRGGILREIQVGELTVAEFDRLYASISGPATGRTR